MFTLLEKNEWVKLASRLNVQKESQSQEAQSKRLKRQNYKLQRTDKKVANLKAREGLSKLKERSDRAIFCSLRSVHVSDTNGHSEYWDSDRFFRHGISAVNWWADKNSKTSSRHSSFFYDKNGSYHSYCRINKDYMRNPGVIYAEITSVRSGKMVSVVKIEIVNRYARGNYNGL